MTGISIFTRRTALLAAGAGSLFGLTGRSGLGSSARGASDTRAALARDAYIWGFPLVQTRLYLQSLKKRNLPLNQYFGAPRLATAADKGAAGPNVDTLYGVAWLDLKAEPQVFSVPDTHGRYYSVQLMDAYENTFSYIGRRATGTKAGHFAIAGPDWHGTLPEGVKLIASSTNTIAFLTRTLVEGEPDLPAALAVQAGYSLTPLSAFPKITNPAQLLENPVSLIPALHANELGVAYFDELSAALVDYPVSGADRRFVKSLAVLGIGPGKTPSKSDDKQLLDVLAAAAVSADAKIHKNFAAGTEDNNGWKVRYGVTGFPSTPLERATEGVLGVGYNINKEALYFFQGKGPDGQALSGDKSYVLNFPAGQLPPVDAFWSLTLYGLDWYLQANPINRYSIGDRTAGLKPSSDGSLQIYLSHEPPASGVSNWLPTPAGPFSLTLRTYQPRPELIRGQYRVPSLALT